MCPDIASPDEKKFIGRLRALIVEDSDNDALILFRMLEREVEDFEGIRVESRSEMEAALDTRPCDLVLCDHDLPQFDAFDALKVLEERNLDIPFIIVTGAIGGEEAAVKLMRLGACDYVPKHKLDRLVPAIHRELGDANIRRAKREADEALRRKNEELESTIQTLMRTEEQLGRSARLKDLGQMAAGVVHDFNNALTKILGLVEIVDGAGIKAISPYMDQLRAAATDATEVVKRLRYFYKASSKTEVAEAVDINEVIRESIELTKPRWVAERLASNSIVQIVSDLGEVPPVLGNAAEYREALANLIFNACDAMSDGGNLTIASKTENEAVIVEVSDTGTGMSEEVLEKCLDPFFSTKEQKGCGLGMSLVDGLVQRYGGVVRVRSTQGEGTTVRLSLSIMENVEHEREEDTPTHQRRRLKVMIVEDEKEIAYLLTRFLEGDNHYVESADNGFAALERIREGNFDVVISDRAMPEIGGDELAIRIRALKGREKIIMATGFGDIMLAAANTPEGVDLVLPKPISRAALRRAIQDVGAYLPS
ncbi:MAG: response regulator [Verrucomicrobiales bacterium]